LLLLTLNYYVLVIDNCPTHFGEVKNLYYAASIKLWYLLLYLIDLNLIKLTFNVFKA